MKELRDGILPKKKKIKSPNYVEGNLLDWAAYTIFISIAHCLITYDDCVCIHFTDSDVFATAPNPPNSHSFSTFCTFRFYSIARLIVFQPGYHFDCLTGIFPYPFLYFSTQLYWQSLWIYNLPISRMKGNEKIIERKKKFKVKNTICKNVRICNVI